LYLFRFQSFLFVGIATLGITALGIATLGITALGITALGIATLGITALGIAILGITALGIAILGTSHLTVRHRIAASPQHTQNIASTVGGFITVRVGTLDDIRDILCSKFTIVGSTFFETFHVTHGIS